MDQLGHTQVCVVGHDWGAPIAWHLALLEPERVRAVVGMAVPFGGRPKQPATAIMAQLYAERFHYILHFQQPGVAEAEMDADMSRTLRMMMYNTSAAAPKDHFLQEKPVGAGLFDGMLDPGTLPAWCDEAAFAHYLKTFEGRGFYARLTGIAISSVTGSEPKHWLTCRSNNRRCFYSATWTRSAPWRLTPSNRCPNACHAWSSTC
jgi:pimeloyl-ACP methyl ester carboxylesterase